MPKFHREMYDDMMMSKSGYVWEMFRESAKSTLIKIGIIHKIVYKKKHFITWTSYDQKKAEGALFDIVIELQTNKRLIEDFGQLFYSGEKESRFSEKKSIKEFITVNDVKVKAYSVGQSMRGEVYKQYRPDLSVLDDIETSKTIVSDSKTSNVIEYFDELNSGLGGSATVFVLANHLTDNGSINYIKNKTKGSYIHRDIPVIKENVIIWNEKYVMTDEEAERRNNDIKDEQCKVVSLETKRRLLGDTVFNREMLNQPLGDDEREFKLKWLQKKFENVNNLANRYITIDVADTKERNDRRTKGKPDYTGTTVVDWDVENNWYIQYAKRNRLNLPELIDWIFYLWIEYKPIKIGIEKKSLEDQVMPYIREKSEETQIYPVIEELKHGGNRKEDRIRGALQGRCQSGKVHFKKNATDNTNDLIKELYDFPKSEFDDCSDALAYIEQIGQRPLIQGSNKIQTGAEKEFFDLREQSQQQIINRLKSL